jgi:hypothetical protein
MELKRAPPAAQIPVSVDVEIGEIVVEGIAIRDPHALRETVRRALERQIAQSSFSGTFAAAEVATVRAADLRPEHVANDRALGEQIAQRVATTVRT